MKREEFIFNTMVYQYINLEDEKGNKVIDEASNIMRSFEEKLSFFKENSEVSLINKNAGVRFVKVSKETFEIIKKAKYYSKITNGLFDITIAPLMELWKISSKSPMIPREKEIKDFLKLVNYCDIKIDEENESVMLLNKNQKIDLGGIAKGYIADKIIEFYERNNVKSAIINIGGNVKVLGKKEDENLWKVGIVEPLKHSVENICAIDVSNKSVVTSGDYERGFICKDKYYHHILNPQNGNPSNSDLKSITLVTDESIDADALATPLFIMGKDDASNFMIANGIKGIMVTNDNKIIINKELLPYFTLIKDYEVLAF
ncbi:FAD:protein FMN transferase [Clostridium perfringens]|nr:FAD:protein FMN transferase [Clostridium perfringens]ELC8454670.1 FAD:protein FMN transferase [Clostridium perfringens]